MSDVEKHVSEGEKNYSETLSPIRNEKRGDAAFTMCIPTDKNDLGPVGKVKIVSSPNNSISAIFKNETLNELNVAPGQTVWIDKHISVMDERILNRSGQDVPMPVREKFTVNAIDKAGLNYMLISADRAEEKTNTVSDEFQNDPNIIETTLEHL